MKNPQLICYYAIEIIKGRWPEAEPNIVKDPQWACFYASHMIKGRWPEAEPYIMKDPFWAENYKDTLKRIQRRKEQKNKMKRPSKS
jgi:predicted Zn-dependent protease